MVTRGVIANGRQKVQTATSLNCKTNPQQGFFAIKSIVAQQFIAIFRSEASWKLTE